MSKSPAALSGPLLSWRRERAAKVSKNQSDPPKSSWGNGRLLAKLSLRKTGLPTTNQKPQ